MKCLNTKSQEYEDLKRSSTLSNNDLNRHCLSFLEKHNRLPRLDEIPGSNSSVFLKESLKVNKDNGTATKNILDFTGLDTVEGAMSIINNHYVDSEISVLELGESSIVDIQLRPTNIYKPIEVEYIPDENVSPMFLIEGLNKLRTLYGYDFKEITNEELASEEWSSLMPTNRTVNAFIYNGDIYINTDNLTPDAKVHEMLHLLIGSIRFTNPDLYTELLKLTTSIPNALETATLKYPDKTLNDALEEYFVEEMAKFLTGAENNFHNLSKELIYEINYNIKRILDTLLMGDYSTKTISDLVLLGMSLKEVTKKVNSRAMTNTFFGTYNVDGSEIHRKLANRKSDLLKSKDLVEVCN